MDLPTTVKSAAVNSFCVELQDLLQRLINLSTSAATLISLHKALCLVISITIRRLGSDTDKDKVVRVCTSTTGFLISSWSASLVSSDVERSGQQPGDSQRNEGPFHHKSLFISALALQSHDGRSV